MKKVVVVGMGYVGLPVLCALAKSNRYNVFGYDIDINKISKLNNKESPIDDKLVEEELKQISYSVSSDPESLKDFDIAIVAVPTPVLNDYTPNLDPIINSVKTLAKFIKKGSMIIIESTINPGVCEEVVIPEIENNSKFREGIDFFVAHCPERINPGDTKWNVYNIPRNIGSNHSEITAELVKFYESFLNAKINPVSSLKVAESTKIIENTFRDINIAYVNELAKSFDILDINLIESIKGASNKPFGFMAHYPGCGVGGHCIPVDPYYLIEKAKSVGFNHEFLIKARDVNNSMPQYTVKLLQGELNNLGFPVKGVKVCILGAAYKKNISDLQESPFFEIKKELKKLGAKIISYDPYVEKYNNFDSVSDAIKNCEAIILVTDHDEFKEINVIDSSLKVVIDGRNLWNAEYFKDKKIKYRGMGR
ncbi:nucleotide sugar dehydrogenase [archaeon]|jgi:UDP-N-acetyl-D-glucosamine dehydrogenase|nr:nucleotide sugar dehydrogenase [archaeon]